MYVDPFFYLLNSCRILAFVCCVRMLSFVSAGEGGKEAQLIPSTPHDAGGEPQMGGRIRVGEGEMLWGK